jgi:hypothetical protein
MKSSSTLSSRNSTGAKTNMNKLDRVTVLAPEMEGAGGESKESGVDGCELKNNLDSPLSDNQTATRMFCGERPGVDVRPARHAMDASTFSPLSAWGRAGVCPAFRKLSAAVKQSDKQSILMDSAYERIEWLP